MVFGRPRGCTEDIADCFLERQTACVQALIAQFDRAAINARVAARFYVHGPSAREGLSVEYDFTLRNLHTAAADYAQRAPSRAEALRWFTQEAATQHDVGDRARGAGGERRNALPQDVRGGRR
eukprot:TRINITY_DN16264_c0_g1_i1.p2 TRINITY_DN16264_c0_g1~~TRINITY_DN16264_c0_g1_i1.p2  ORF type:complete len:123 (+),score=26.75 TRINITY_DN16264_c0_g1_i1:85-453(+)